MARFAVGVPLILLLVSVAFAQNPPQSDPQAVSLAPAASISGKAIVDGGKRVYRSGAADKHGLEFQRGSRCTSELQRTDAAVQGRVLLEWSRLQEPTLARWQHVATANPPVEE
jgi:hypothetical protein